MSQSKELEAIKEYHKGALNSLYASLSKKSDIIQAMYLKELTEPVMKKLKHEEEHIRICLEYVEIVDKLIKDMDKALVCKNMLLEFFKKESLDYMDQFYNSVDSNAEYQLLKKILKSNESKA